MTNPTKAAVGAADSGLGLDAEFLAKLKEPGYLDALIKAGREGAVRKREIGKRLDTSEAAFRKILLQCPSAELLASVRSGHEGVIAIAGISQAFEFLASDPSIGPTMATERAVANLASAGRFCVETPLDDLDQLARVSARIRTYVETRLGATLEAAKNAAMLAHRSVGNRVGNSTADEASQDSPASTAQTAGIDAADTSSPSATSGKGGEQGGEEADQLRGVGGPVEVAEAGSGHVGDGDEKPAKGDAELSEKRKHSVKEWKERQRGDSKPSTTAWLFNTAHVHETEFHRWQRGELGKGTKVDQRIREVLGRDGRIPPVSPVDS